jgi:hypothetical protein
MLAAILERAAAPIPVDVPSSNEIFVIANAVEGIEPRVYRFTPPDGFELVRAGSFRRQGRLPLPRAAARRSQRGQSSSSPSSAPSSIRSETAATAPPSFEAGIRTGRIYLGAYASGFAATASTFYDDDVTCFVAPGTGKSPLLAAAVGYPAT